MGKKNKKAKSKQSSGCTTQLYPVLTVSDKDIERESALLECAEWEAQRERQTELALSPVKRSASALSTITGNDDVQAITDALQEMIDSRDTGIPHLISQAMTLDATAYRLLDRAEYADNPKHIEMYMKNYFKAVTAAKNQWLAINEIRHPRKTKFINQLNQAAGHQQINNGSNATQAEISDNPPNELTPGVIGGVYENGRAQTTISGEESDSQTVVEINRPKNKKREKTL